LEEDDYEREMAWGGGRVSEHQGKNVI